MKKIVASIIISIICISCIFANGSEEKKVTQWPLQIAIATAGTGGAYYPVGVGLSEVFKKTNPNLNITVEVTGGTVENPGLVEAGDCEVGIANSDMAYFAKEGTAPFEVKHPNLRGFVNGMAPGVVHYAVLESSSVKSLADLVGKRIAVGPQGNSTSLFLEKVLNSLDASWKDITPSYMSFSDGIQALIDGKVDMAVVSAGPPVSSIQELVASGKKFRLLQFDDEFRTKFLDQYPYYIGYTIERNIYGLDEDVQTVATTNMLMINASLPEDFVYALTKSIFENLEYLGQVANSMKTVTLKDAPNTSIPLHDGAARFYKEMGVLK